LGSNMTKGINHDPYIEPTWLVMNTKTQNFHSFSIRITIMFLGWYLKTYFICFTTAHTSQCFLFIFKCCIKYTLGDLCNPFIISSFKVELKYCFHPEDEWYYFKVTAGQWSSWENCIVKKLLTSHKLCDLDEHIL
jgi:hypothetical protein